MCMSRLCRCGHGWAMRCAWIGHAVRILDAPRPSWRDSKCQLRVIRRRRVGGDQLNLLQDMNSFFFFSPVFARGFSSALYSIQHQVCSVLLNVTYNLYNLTPRTSFQSYPFVKITNKALKTRDWDRLRKKIVHYTDGIIRPWHQNFFW